MPPPAGGSTPLSPYPLNRTPEGPFCCPQLPGKNSVHMPRLQVLLPDPAAPLLPAAARDS